MSRTAKDEISVTQVMHADMVSRYSMPILTQAVIKQAGDLAVARLFDMLSEKETFDKLTQAEKMEVMRMAMDRAFGRTEGAVASHAVSARMGLAGVESVDSSSHGAQIEALAQRVTMPEFTRTKSKTNENVQLHQDGATKMSRAEKAGLRDNRKVIDFPQYSAIKDEASISDMPEADTFAEPDFEDD